MAPQHSSKKRKRVTEIEALPWIMGEDGIEELEGVEVVQNGGQVEFLVSNTAKRTKTDGVDEDMAETEEWGGIDDEDDDDEDDDDDDDDDDKDKADSANPDVDANVEKTGTTPEKLTRKAEKKKEWAEKAKEAKKEKKAKAKAKAKEKATQGDDPAAGFAALEALEGGERDPDVDMSEWLPLSLSPDMVAALARLRFSSPTPIQSASIPEILEGKDVIGKASTGSGKTLAFAIPVVERWLELRDEKIKTAAESGMGEDTDEADDKADDKADDEGDDEEEEEVETEAHVPIALVLSPTRELAHQITKHIIALVETMPNPPRVCAVTGGLSIYKQQRQLAKADIVVGTPGRLWEVLGDNGDRGRLLEAFKKVRFLVVDEADRLLSEGHFKDAEEIIAALDKVNVDEDDEGSQGGDDDEDKNEDKDEDKNEDKNEEGARRPERQTLVFSATFNKNLQQKLAGKGIKYDLMDDRQSMEYLLKKLNFREERPRFIDVNPVSQMADGLREGLIECGAMEKDLFLYAAILLSNCKRTLVFTNSIAAVRRLTPMLQLLQLPAQPLHSQMAQKARLRSLEKFKETKEQQTSNQKPNAAPKLKRPPVPSVLVATDVAARGLDIPNVDCVIHYHVPRAADAYVHRSGRTARGASSGLSILLCAPEEVVPTRRLAAKVHARKAAASTKKAGYMLHTIDVDRRIAGRLKERVTLAKKIADADLAKEKGHKEDGWMQAAADELGIDLDEVDAKGMGKLGWTGRGGGRKRKEAEARELSKAEIGAMRAKLKDALSKRVNAGVSERYVTGGAVDVAELLRDGVNGGLFLGKVDGLEI